MTKPVLHPELCQRIGFGCGRLVGGTSFKESALLLEAAAELGIRYFDTAPSYGLGSAERVLGEVLGGDPQFEIATKVGISRPKNPTLLSAARSVVAPIARKVAPLKRLALSMLSRHSDRHELNSNELLASFEESLHYLKRSSVDVLFLHEAIGLDSIETQQFFEQMYKAQKCRYFGAAISAQNTGIKFGNAIQLGYGDNFVIPSGFGLVNIHGVLRTNKELNHGDENFLLNDRLSNLFNQMSQRDIDAATKIYCALSLSDVSKILISKKSIESLRNVLCVTSALLESKS